MWCLLLRAPGHIALQNVRCPYAIILLPIVFQTMASVRANCRGEPSLEGRAMTAVTAETHPLVYVTHYQQGYCTSGAVVVLGSLL